MEPSPFLPQTTMAIEKVKIAAMLPSLFERSLEFNRFYKYNRTSKFLIISKIKLISQKQNFLNRIQKNLNWEG